MVDFQQTWVNKSSTVFYRDGWGAQGDAVLTNYHVTPSETLKAGEGSETLSWSQTASTIAGGFANGRIVWRAQNSDKSYGVQIQVPLQLILIGSAPYYQVQQDGGNWEGEHKSAPYEFSTNGCPYKIQAAAIAGHSSLSIVITITDRA